MSNSLVRKSLELLGYEKNIKEVKKKKKRAKYKGALDLIPAKHRVVSKRDKTDLTVVLNRSKRITVHEAKKQLEKRQDPTEDNVQRLLLLSKNRVDSETADKLLKRAVKKQYIPKKEKPKEQESTAFTEEDFKRFEQEYVE